MDIYEKRGTNFEVSVSVCLERIPNSVVITHFDVFSFSLNKVTPIDILVLLGHHIFILELKRFSDSIVGKYSERRWFGISNQRRYFFFNPIIQVKEKVRCMQRKLNECGLKYWELDWNYFVVVPDSCCITSDRTIIITQQELFQKIVKIRDVEKQGLDILKVLIGGG